MSKNAGWRKLTHVLVSIGATLVIGGSVTVPAVAVCAGGSPAASTVTVAGSSDKGTPGENNWH